MKHTHIEMKAAKSFQIKHKSFTLIGLLIISLILIGCGEENKTSKRHTDDSSIIGGWSCTDGLIHMGSPTQGFYLFTDGNGVLIHNNDTVSMTWSTRDGKLTINYRDSEEGLMGSQVLDYSIDKERKIMLVPDDPFMFGCTEFSRADLRLFEWADQPETTD